MQVEIRVLGRFAVTRDGHEVDARLFGGRLARRLVALLAAHRGALVTRDGLIEALWGDRAPADPDGNLNALVNRARRALGDPTLVRTVDGGYLLAASPDLVVDVDAFVADVTEARARLAADPAGALALVERALNRWGEPWADDAYADWAQSHRDRLQRARQEALEVGAAAARVTGAHGRAVELATEATRLAPLREPAQAVLIEALAAGGDQVAALGAYSRLRERLADELGVDPGPDLRRLHLRLLNGEPSTTPARSARPFVGRTRELSALTTASRVALLSGRPGAGKSRLLAEFAARQDRPVLHVRAASSDRRHPWSVAAAILRVAVAHGASIDRVGPLATRAALASLLPELGDPDTAWTADPRTARTLVVEGALEMLRELGEAVLIVDDLQWADASSLELLTVLAARADDLRIVLAFRAGEAERSFLDAIRMAHLPEEIKLGALGHDDIGRLIADPELARIVAGETDRTPFAVLEVLRVIEHGADHRRVREAARMGRLRSVLARVAPLSAGARDVLGVVALLGRPAPLSLLVASIGESADTVADHLVALDEAELVAFDRRGYGTTHDLVADAVRDGLTAPERVRLHLMIADVLAREPGSAAEWAHHLAEAGDRHAAVAAFVEAGRAQVGQFADQEAAQLIEAGLALDPNADQRVELLRLRAEIRARAGSLGTARDDLRAALQLVPGGPTRARVLTKLAELSSGSDDLVHAVDLVDLALLEAKDDPSARAAALTTAAILDMNLERLDRAESRFDQARTLFRELGDAVGVSDVQDGRAMATFLRGDIDSAISELGQTANLFFETGNLLRMITPRTTRGHALIYAGQPRRALEDIESALDTARYLGSPEGEATAQWLLSEAHLALGAIEDAVQHAERALEIATALGHRGWTITARCGLGLALRAAGRTADAEVALREATAESARFPLFDCWAHARLALLLVDTGRLAEAAEHVDVALVTGPPVGHYEARLAACTLAVAEGRRDAGELVEDALARAETGGHHASLAPLRALLEPHGISHAGWADR